MCLPRQQNHLICEPPPLRVLCFSNYSNMPLIEYIASHMYIVTLATAYSLHAPILPVSFSRLPDQISTIASYLLLLIYLLKHSDTQIYLLTKVDLTMALIPKKMIYVYCVVSLAFKIKTIVDTFVRTVKTYNTHHRRVSTCFSTLLCTNFSNFPYKIQPQFRGYSPLEFMTKFSFLFLRAIHHWNS